MKKSIFTGSWTASILFFLLLLVSSAGKKGTATKFGEFAKTFIALGLKTWRFQFFDTTGNSSILQAQVKLLIFYFPYILSCVLLNMPPYFCTV